MPCGEIRTLCRHIHPERAFEPLSLRHPHLLRCQRYTALCKALEILFKSCPDLKRHVFQGRPICPECAHGGRHSDLRLHKRPLCGQPHRPQGLVLKTAPPKER